MPQRTLTLDALIDRLEALCEQYGGETPVYIEDADTAWSLGITLVAFQHTCNDAPIPGVYLAGSYRTDNV